MSSYTFGKSIALPFDAAVDRVASLIAGNDTSEGDLATARTAGFTVLVFASLFNCLNARSDTASAFVRLFANRWLCGAIAASTLLQVAVVHLGFLNLASGTAPLAPHQWLVCVAMASGVLWFSELRKWVSLASRRHDLVAVPSVDADQVRMARATHTGSVLRTADGEPAGALCRQRPGHV